MTFKFKPSYWPANAIQIGIDLETASTADNAAIVQLSAVTYSTPLPAFFDVRIDLKSNEAHGMDVSCETMKWWSEQDPALRKKVFGGTTHIKDAVLDFIEWCRDISKGDFDRIFLWGNGPEFDITILRNAVQVFDTWPFHYRNADSLRTLERIVPIPIQEAIFKKYVPVLGTEMVAHDAFCDAEFQAYKVEKYLEYLGSL